MLEHILLGTAQGITEWLPVSSKAVIILIKTQFAAGPIVLEEAIREALFLHLGTFLAALIYFRNDVATLFRHLVHYRSADDTNKRLLFFLAGTTLISGAIGFPLLKLFEKAAGPDGFSASLLAALIGIFLIATGILQLRSQSGVQKKTTAYISRKDTVLLGITQACAALPGLSRSGLTISALLLRGFDKETALRLSFLMSLPIILAGNIVLNIRAAAVTKESLVGLIFSFIFGYATIRALLALARKINFGVFVICFGTITIAFSLLS